MVLVNNPREIHLFNADRFAKTIELQLSDQVAQWPRMASAASGRSSEEIVLELLARSIKSL